MTCTRNIDFGSHIEGFGLVFRGAVLFFQKDLLDNKDDD